MADPDLLQNFRACLRYKQAAKWRKPLVDPVRFVRNQLRIRGVGRGRPGEPAVVRAFHLPNFTIVTGEILSEVIASYGVYEESLTEAFVRLVEPGQVVVDIGMHLGYYTTLLARLVESHGAVHAFEPTPSTRTLAARNTGQFPQARVHPYAVWHREEKLTFHDYGLQWMAFNSFTVARMQGGGPPAPKPFEAETITLDGFRRSLGQTLALVKIDAESAERQILEGARELLASDRPLVSLEVGDAPGAHESRGLIDWMAGAGYASWEFSAGKFLRHTPRQSYSYDNLIFAPQSYDLSAK